MNKGAKIKKMVLDHKDEQRGKNKENKGVFVFGSSFSGLRFGVFVFGS